MAGSDDDSNAIAQPKETTVRRGRRSKASRGDSVERVDLDLRDGRVVQPSREIVALTSRPVKRSRSAFTGASEKTPYATPGGATGCRRTFDEALADVAAVAIHAESGAGMAPVELAFAAAKANTFAEGHTKVIQELVDELETTKTGTIRSAETDAAIMVEMATLIGNNTPVHQVQQRKAEYMYNYTRATTDESRKRHKEGAAASSTPSAGPRVTAPMCPNVSLPGVVSCSSDGVGVGVGGGAAIVTTRERIAPAVSASAAAAEEDNVSGTVRSGSASTSGGETAESGSPVGRYGERKRKGKARAVPPNCTTTTARVATTKTSAAVTASTGAGAGDFDADDRAAPTPVGGTGSERTYEEALAEFTKAAIRDGSSMGTAPVVIAFAAATKSASSEVYTPILQELVNEAGTTRTRNIGSVEAYSTALLEMAALISSNAPVDQVRQIKATYIYHSTKAAEIEGREGHDGGSAGTTPCVSLRAISPTLRNVNMSAIAPCTALRRSGKTRGSSSSEISPGAAAAREAVATETSPLDITRATAVFAEIGCIPSYRLVIDDFSDQLKFAVASAHVFPQADVNAIMLELASCISFGASAGDVEKRKDEWLAGFGISNADEVRAARGKRWYEQGQIWAGTGSGLTQEPESVGMEVVMGWGAGAGGDERVAASSEQNQDKGASQMECYVIQHAAPSRHRRGPHFMLMVPDDKAESTFVATEFATMNLILLLGIEDAHAVVCDMLRLSPVHFEGRGVRLGLSLDVIPAPFNAQYLGPFGRAGLVCGDLIMDINGTNVASPNGRRTFKKGGTRVEPWLRVSFLRATGETNLATICMVSPVVQHRRTMLSLIAQQRKALTLESQGARQGIDPEQQKCVEDANAALAYEDFGDNVSRLVGILAHRCEDDMCTPTVIARRLEVRMKTRIRKPKQ